MQLLISPLKSQISRAHSLVLTTHPQIKVIFVIHTTLLLDRNVIKSFHHSGNAKIIISASSACSVTTCTAVREHRQSGRRVCRVLKSDWIDPFHPLISGWLRAAQRLNLPQRPNSKWEHDCLTPPVCSETHGEARRKRERDSHLYKRILVEKCTGWELISFNWLNMVKNNG